jgi:hypothetical protein
MEHDLQRLADAEWRTEALTPEELGGLERLLEELCGHARGGSFADLALALELDLATA